MAKLVNEYLAGKYPVGNNRLGLYDRLFAQKIFDTGIITTATGNPVSIVTNKAQNAISTLLSYSPKQSGSGDPSPQNIRPFLGVSEANLFGCGKNLFDSSGGVVNGNYYDPSGNITHYDSITVYRNQFFKEGNYTIRWKNSTPQNYMRVNVLNLDGSFVSRILTSTTSPFSFTLSKDSILQIATDNAVSNIQLEIESQVTDYEPYTQGANITESLGGTYYGFSVDLERGALKLLWYADDLGSFEWHASNAADGRFYCTATSHRYKNPSSMICSIYKNDGVGSQQGGYYGENGTFRYWSGSSITELYVRDTRFPNVSDLPDFVQAITGQKVCYELYTPIELPLTPQTVALLKGNNTLWCDGDSLSVTYKAKKA